MVVLYYTQLCGVAVICASEQARWVGVAAQHACSLSRMDVMHAVLLHENKVTRPVLT